MAIRAYLEKYRILRRFKLVVLQASMFQLQDVFAMSEEIRINFATEYFAKGLTAGLIAGLAGEEITICPVRYPANWKEAVLERFLPRWLKKRRPIRYTYVYWDACVVYPKISLPEEEHQIAYVRTRTEESKEVGHETLPT